MPPKVAMAFLWTHNALHPKGGRQFEYRHTTVSENFWGSGVQGLLVGGLQLGRPRAVQGGGSKQLSITHAPPLTKQISDHRLDARINDVFQWNATLISILSVHNLLHFLGGQ